MKNLISNNMNNLNFSTTNRKTTSLRLHKEDLIVHYKTNFRYICITTVLIPLITLLLCLFGAYIFQFDAVHETHCKVFNIIPSISAVTGISPQRYFWRISIALHIGPRILISHVYNSYQLNRINSASVDDQQIKLRAEMWIYAAYFLNLVETGALCGVAYISNRENYPIHEKLFIIFIISSLCHMIACIEGTKIAAESRGGDYYKSVEINLKYKKTLLLVSLWCTFGLVVFYMQHRYFCFRMAFSMFALCEYLIAAANIAFHIIVILDFPTEDLIIGRIVSNNDNPQYSGDIKKNE